MSLRGVLAQAAGQLLTLFGDGALITLRRYDHAGEVDPVTSLPVAAAGPTATVEVRYAITDFEAYKAPPDLQAGDKLLVIEASGWPAGERLDGRWTAQEPNSRELPLVGPIRAAGGGGIIYQATLRTAL